MDILIATILLVVSIVAGIFGNLIASELYDCGPSLARWLIDRAVARLPAAERERSREEWYADNNRWPGGKLGKVRHAVGCWLGAPAVARALEVGSKAADAGQDRKLEVELKKKLIIEYFNRREQWLAAFEDESKEAERMLRESREDRAFRSEYYQYFKDKFFDIAEQVSDDINSEQDLIDAFLQWRRFRSQRASDD